MPQIKQLLENNERIYPVTPASAVFFEDQSRLSDKVFANNGVLTIQKNGVTIGTFSANASTNSTINITTSDSDALAALFASVSYDSTNKKIEFFNTSNTKVGELDATAFIKDGMVSDVRIETPSTGPNAGEPCLIIDFNTDAEGEGKTDIEIPLSGIFDPDNYYTKTQADNKFLTIATYTADEQVVSASLNDLDSRVSTNTAAISALQQGETYTTAEKTKLAGIETGAEANVIEEVQVNGTPLTITNKAVNVDLSDYLTVSDYESDEEVIAESLNDLNTRLNDTVSQQDFQAFSQSIEDDFLLKETYAADERVVAASLNDLNTRLDSKQDKLVSGTSIKTVNNQSLLGSGDIELVDTDTLSENEKVTAAALLDLHDKADEHDARLDSLQEQIYPVPELTKQVGELQSEIVWIPGDGQNSAVLRGSNSVASGTNSVAEGRSTIAHGSYSHAEGYSNGTSGEIEITGIANATQYSVNNATNLSIGTVLVYDAKARPITAIDGTTITVAATFSDTALSAAVCEYYNTGAFSNATHVEGYNTIAASAGSHAEGRETRAVHNQAHAEGNGTIVIAPRGHAEGYKTTVSGTNGHAEGSTTIASGNSSHAEGYSTRSTLDGAHAEGGYTLASAIAAHAEGHTTEATGAQAHTGGYLTMAGGNMSFAHGNVTDATTTSSIALGTGAHVYSSSSSAGGGFALGASSSYDINPIGDANATTYTCTTSEFESEISDAQLQQIFGNCIIWNRTSNAAIPMAKITSFTVNSNTDNTRSITFTTDRTLSETALDGSVTFGLPGTIANYWALAGNSTRALGANSVALGRGACTLNPYSISIGPGTLTRNNNEVATGKYNLSTSGHTNFSIGNGTSSARSNVIEVVDSDNVYIKGIGGYDGTNYASATTLQDTVNNSAVWEVGNGENSVQQKGGAVAAGAHSVAEGVSSNPAGTIYVTSNINDPARTYDVNFNSITVNVNDILVCEGIYDGVRIVTAVDSSTITVNDGFGEGEELDNEPVVVYHNGAIGDYSHAEGYQTTASDSASHAEGWQTKAMDVSAHAEGTNTTATRQGAHAEGGYTNANGDYSHAEGLETTASFNGSHAEGSRTTASGEYSHAEGYYTNTQNQSEHAEGQYNLSTKTSPTFGNAGNTTFSHGIGTGSGASAVRKNAIEIMENGDTYIYGIGGYDGTNYSTASSLQTVVGGTSSYEVTTNKVTSLSASSTDTQYPSAKCVYDLIGDIETVLDTIINGSNAS